MFLKISLILIVVKYLIFYISFSISNDLPRTSYLKMVDIWLIFNLFIPFVEVLLHTYKVNSRLTIQCLGPTIPTPFHLSSKCAQYT